MKIVKLKGGIGNQLFQYAFAKYLEAKCGEEVYLDLSSYGDAKEDINGRKPIIFELVVSLKQAADADIKKTCIFRHGSNAANIRYKFFVLLEAVFNRRYILEKGKRQKKFEEVKDYTYFDGYWQSYEYADYLKDVIKKEFQPVAGISQIIQKEIEDNAGENLVFVGIRMGDYAASRVNRKKHGVFEEPYYKEAMEIISKRTKNPIFYIFSNDIEWVKSNMDFKPYKVKYREQDKQVSDLEELYVMAGCKHAVISNSTFYWWGAWMIDNPNKIVVAPKNWFADGRKTDIIPPDWITI